MVRSGADYVWIQKNVRDPMRPKKCRKCGKPFTPHDRNMIQKYCDYCSFWKSRNDHLLKAVRRAEEDARKTAKVYLAKDYPQAFLLQLVTQCRGGILI